MKQHEIIEGATYRLARMQYIRHPLLNNKITTVHICRSVLKGDPAQGGAGSRAALYMTQFSVPVMATNLIPVDETYEVRHHEEPKRSKESKDV